MHTRLAYSGFSAFLLAGLIAACSSQAPPAGPKTGGEVPTAKATTSTSAPATAPPPAQSSPAAPSSGAAPPSGAASPTVATKAVAPAASPAASPPTAAAARVEPKGKLTYSWHTAITPAWFDSQENPALATPYGFQYALHDAVVRHMPGQPFAPSLAETYEVAPDFKTATFKLRPNIKFHNGEPVTAEDAKWTFENYRGANAKVLKDKTASIETPDPRTIKFTFKEPFLDFIILYGSAASGAGWVVPAKYYQQVGPDGFKQKPIGAGPYKFVKQTGGQEFEFEAFTDYWRKSPNVKTLIYKGITEDATRLATLQTGEGDMMNLVPGQLIETAKADPKLQLAPVLTAPFWLEFVGYEKPDSPFNKKQVRQAISLALDRQAISQAEEGGLSGFEGNWIPGDWPGSLKRPMPEYDLAKAKQLMAEAGMSNGFEAGQITPLPPYNSLAERVATSLREIGIRVQLNQMERAAFATKLTEGPGAFNGIILHISGNPGDAAARVRSFMVCKGASSRACDPEIDTRFTKYEASANPQEREQLMKEIQEYILDNFVLVPIYRQAAIQMQGPRVANKWDTIWGAIPQYPYIGPFEDIQIKE